MRQSRTLLALAAITMLLPLAACGADGGSAGTTTGDGTSSSGGTSSGGTSSGGASSGGTSSGGASSGGEVVKLELGADCKGHGECKSGLCDNAICAQAQVQLKIGEKCDADGLCESGICFGGACAKACTGIKDCAGENHCLSDGERAFCAKPTYAAELGTSCAATGKCPGDLTCSNKAEAVGAICTAACKTDLDCPANLSCRDRGDGQNWCLARSFCDSCQTDAHCGDGNVCVDMGSGTGKYCSKPCTMGSTECPRYAECKDVGGGKAACAHRAGSCSVANPGLCSPCNGAGTCQQGGMCLRWPTTMEFFCGKTCTNDASCGAGYKCYTVTQAGNKQCVPAVKKQTAYPGKNLKNNVTQFATCVNKISNRYEVGDIMEDYAMVGVVDTDGDDSILDEEYRVVKLSDFDVHKVIFFTVSAGWCGACQQETLDFKNLYKQYGGNLVIFQTLFEGYTPGKTLATFNVLKQWNTKLKPIGGAFGVDYTQRVRTMNVLGSTPMNMLLDAKTRKVLAKWNGYSHGSFVAQLNKIMKNYK